MLNRLLRPLKKNQFFWDWAQKISGLYLPDFFFKNVPDTIIIELTNACNLRCPVCPTHLYMKRARGYMDLDMFKGVIDEFDSSSKKPRLAMSFAGEPLLHPKVDEFVAYAEKKGLHTYISTNATLLRKELSARLIQAGLSDIHVCLEGMTKEAHESYRFGSDFDVVKQNIEDLLAEKRRLQSKVPKVVVQTLLTSLSEGHVDEMVAWARDAGADGINFKSMSMGTYTSDELKQKYAYLLPKAQNLRRKNTSLNKTLCSLPSNDALIFWDGALGLCCVDFDKAVPMSNVNDGGFLKAFNSDRTLQARKLGFRKKFQICKTCSIGNADFMGWNVDFTKEKGI